MNSEVLSGFLGAPGPLFYGGKEVQAFERESESLFSYKHAVTVNSWTSGLQACIGAIGIEPGDEIICPPYTMSASASCAFFYGGIPVFADVKHQTGCLDPESVKARISERTKAIMVVHLFGYPAQMDELCKIAREHNLAIIEDAAQAPGTLYKGKQVGAIGDIGGFSLNFHKHIHTGEGGIIVTNNDELAERCRYIRNHGENIIESFPYQNPTNLIGGNYRLSELQAALGNTLLPKLSTIVEKRIANATILNKRFEGIPGLQAQKLEHSNDRHSYYLYPMTYSESIIGLPRSLFAKAICAELPKPSNWETIPIVEGYCQPLYWSDLYQKQIAIGKNGFPFKLSPGASASYQRGSCPVTEQLYLKDQFYTALIMECNGEDEMHDFADACEKVIYNASSIKDKLGDSITDGSIKLSHDRINDLK